MTVHLTSRRVAALLAATAVLAAGLALRADAAPGTHDPAGPSSTNAHISAGQRPDHAGRPADGPGQRPRDGGDGGDGGDGVDQPGEGVAMVVDGFDDDWVGEPTWIPGTANYDAGVWSFTDYPYDDAGTGSFEYPAGDDHGANAADPVVLQIALGDDAVHYLVRLNTLIRPDTTVVALAVDTDGDETTGGGEWPRNAKARSDGWEKVITVWGTGGIVTTHEGDEIAIPVVANTDENLIEFAVPFSVADPHQGTWRYRGGAGLWDAGAGEWMEVEASSPLAPDGAATGKSSPDHPNIFNLLFRNRTWDGGTPATDENSSGGFQTSRQAAALTANALGDFHRDVDFAVLESGAGVAPAEPTGDHNFTRVYASAAFPNALPEGVTAGHNAPTGSIYNGRYQPYGIFVPGSYWEGLPEPAPLVPQLHGWFGDHRGFNPANNDFWNQVVRANRAVVAKPLGRGEEVWYEHLGELDTLEIIADVARHYEIDADRVYLAGTSMGGLGTIKIAESHPDLFAGIFPSVPPMSDRAQGYVVPENNDWDLAELVGSLRNVPVRNFFGTADALVPANYDSERFCDALAAWGHDHDCWRDVQGGHSNYDNARWEEIALLFDRHRRVRDPARVTYQSHPVFRRQAAEVGIGHLLRYDRAYWVGNIRWPAPPVDGGCHLADCLRETPGYPTWPTDPGTARRLTQGSGISTLDVRTWGRGEGDPVAEAFNERPSPTLWRRGIELRPGPAVAARNAFELSVTDVVGLDLDLGRMGLGVATPLTGELSGEGTLQLGLVTDGTAGSCAARVDGASVPLGRDGDRLTLSVWLTPAPRTLEVTCSG